MKDSCSKSEIIEKNTNIENDDENIESSESSGEDNEDSYEIEVEIRTNEEDYNNDGKIYENEEENIKIESSVRNGFIKKVYGILSVQLIITFSFVFLFQINLIKKTILSNINVALNILTISSILFFLIFLVLFCSRNLSKTVPYNYILLFCMTLCEAFSCSIISSCYSFEIVAITLFLTLLSTLIITFYSCTSKNDFSSLKATLLIIFCQLIMSGFISIILKMKILYMFYIFLSTITIGIYLVYDTQLIMGKFGYAYSVDDYIFASLEIYMDIIRLFLTILRIVSQASSKKH